MRRIKELMKPYRESKKSSVIVYLILRVLTITCIVTQMLRGEFENAFMCFLYLIVMTLPIIIQDRFKIELPNFLETVIYVFIFSGTVLGSVYNFFGNIPHWDTMLHTINGFICAGIGLSLIDLLNRSSNKIDLSPFYTVLIAFCFSMTVGIVWEFYEYGIDKVLLVDSQDDVIVTTISSNLFATDGKRKAVIIENIDKTILYDAAGNELITITGGYLDIGLNDTMKDLLVNFIGASIFSILGYFYIKNQEKYQFTKNFIPTKRLA